MCLCAHACKWRGTAQHPTPPTLANPPNTTGGADTTTCAPTHPTQPTTQHTYRDAIRFGGEGGWDWFTHPLQLVQGGLAHCLFGGTEGRFVRHNPSASGRGHHMDAIGCRATGFPPFLHAATHTCKHTHTQRERERERERLHQTPALVCVGVCQVCLHAPTHRGRGENPPDKRVWPPLWKTRDSGGVQQEQQ